VDCAQAAINLGVGGELAGSRKMNKIGHKFRIIRHPASAGTAHAHGRLLLQGPRRLPLAYKAGAIAYLLPAAVAKESLQFFVVSKSLPAASADKLKAALDKLSKSGELGKIFARYSHN
jgi:hypothetical protein